jgi:hypothetical protein
MIDYKEMKTQKNYFSNLIQIIFNYNSNLQFQIFSKNQLLPIHNLDYFIHFPIPGTLFTIVK